MARILHLEDDKSIQLEVVASLSPAGHVVTVCDSVNDAEMLGAQFELYICGSLGKHSDGLIFALDKIEHGAKVLVVADKCKFSKLPFYPTSALENRARFRQKVIRILLNP